VVRGGKRRVLVDLHGHRTIAVRRDGKRRRGSHAAEGEHERRADARQPERAARENARTRATGSTRLGSVDVRECRAVLSNEIPP